MDNVTLIICYWLGKHKLYNDMDIEDLEQIIKTIKSDYYSTGYHYINEYLESKGTRGIEELIDTIRIPLIQF